MEAVIFIGLQGSGQSAFFKRRFAPTHVHISLDLQKNRKREMRLLESCIRQSRDFAVDNTNPTALERQKYIQPAKAAGYIVHGYYFDCSIQECLRRNQPRSAKARIPPPALYATRKRMQPPSPEEGFDALFRVQPQGEDEFLVTPMDLISRTHTS